MSNMKLFINGQPVDLDDKTVISQNVVVNDLVNLHIRHASFTNAFTVPKTARNNRVLELMSMPGVFTNIPYQKNTVHLYAETGECLVYKGWAFLQDNGDRYQIAIQEGVVDIFKDFGNDSLANLDLSSLQHAKDVATVVNSWNNDLPYRYILADYNGNTGNTNFSNENPIRRVNIDYLVPSVKVSYLFDKIKERYGFTAAGSVFNKFDFTNLYMTFPKGLAVDDNAHTVAKSTQYDPANGTNAGAGIYLYYAKTGKKVLFNDGTYIAQWIQQSGATRVWTTGNDNKSVMIPVIAGHEIKIEGRSGISGTHENYWLNGNSHVNGAAPEFYTGDYATSRFTGEGTFTVPAGATFLYCFNNGSGSLRVTDLSQSAVETNELVNIIDGIHHQVGETATYKMKIKGSISGSLPLEPEMLRDSRIRIVKNSQGLAPNTAWPNQMLQDGIPIFETNLNNLLSGSEFEFESIPFQLMQYDALAFVITGVANNQPYVIDETNFNLDVTINRIDAVIVDFTQAFTDFPVKDFFKDILYRFGLTVYKDKYTNHYNFFTMREVLLNPQIYDWSDKYHGLKGGMSTKYGDYARRNFFRYTYNDKEASHNDAFFAVDNVNLDDSIDVIKSKIYSPERLLTKYLDEQTHVYKIWDKEVNDSGGIEGVATYKPLDKRYYFMRERQVTEVDITVYSDVFNISQETDMFYRESFWKLNWEDIKNDYYSQITSILNRPVVIEGRMLLSAADISELDLSRLVYIKQLSSYFLINQVKDYQGVGLTDVELVRVLYTDPQSPVQSLFIGNVEKEPEQPVVKLTYSSSYTLGTLKVYRSQDELNWVETFAGFNDNVAVLLVPALIGTGTWYFRIKDETNNITSNTVEVLL